MTDKQIARLMELQKLYEEGILNENDLANEKAKILGTSKPHEEVKKDEPQQVEQNRIESNTIESKKNNLKDIFKKIKLPLFIGLGILLLVGMFNLAKRYKYIFSKPDSSSIVVDDSRTFEDKFERLWVVGSERDYTESDFLGWSKDDLRILRNYFFARNNFIFKSKELKVYFSRYTWYQPLYEDVGYMFSDLQTNNVQFIKKLEGLSNYYNQK